MGYTVEQKLPVQNALTKEPSGFTNPDNVIVTYDPASLKVTLTGTVVAYWQGVVIPVLVSGWLSAVHTDSAGTYYLYYNGSAFVWSNSIWTIDMLQIAIVQYAGSNVGWATRECHGMMPYQVHDELHDVIGTYVDSGGGATSLSYTLNSQTVANRRPLFNQVVINDEDLPTTVAALISASYTQCTLGTGLAYTLTTGQNDIVPLNGNVPYYNAISVGNGTQVAMTNNQYQKLFVVAVPVTTSAYAQLRRFVIFQGQTVSSTLATIQAITFRSINKGTFTTFVAEYVPVIEIIIQYQSSGNNWALIEVNTVNESRGSTSTSGVIGLTSVSTTDYLSGNGTGSSPIGIVGTGTAGSVVYDTGTILAESADYTYNNTTKQITVGGAVFSNRVLLKQGVDVVCANNLTLGADGNIFNITTGVNTLNLINSASWQAGSRISLKFTVVTIIQHNQAVSTTYYPIILATSANFTTSVGQTVEFELRGDSLWYEVGQASLVGTASGAYWNTVLGSPTRVSNTQFTVTDTSNTLLLDKKYSKGTVLMWTETGTKMAMITSAAYNTNVVTINIAGDVLAAGFAAMKYTNEKARMLDFKTNMTFSTGSLTNVMATQYIQYDIKPFAVEFSCTAGSGGTGNLVVDFNDDGTTITTSKLTLANTTANALVTVNTATVVLAGSALTVDVDSVLSAPTTFHSSGCLTLYYLANNNQYL